MAPTSAAGGGAEIERQLKPRSPMDMNETTTTSSAAHDWPDRMIEVLTDQNSIVGELAGLAARQTGLIEANRTDALLTLLTERQILIDRFAASQETLTQLSSEIAKYGARISGEQREHLRELVSTISNRLADVLHADERDQRTLEHSREAARNEIRTVDRAAQARQAYGGDGRHGTRLTDERR